MNRVFPIFILLSALFFSFNISAATIKVLVLGDNLSSGDGIERDLQWVRLLAYKINVNYKKYRVINRSLSGDVTQQSLERLPALLKRYRPKVVIIQMGGNDGLQGLSVNQIASNLDKMIEISKDAGARVLLLGMQLPARFGLRYSYQFGKLYINVADDHNIHMVSLLLRQVALNSTEENSDTLLVNKNGQEVIFESVWPFLVPLLNAAEMDRLEE